MSCIGLSTENTDDVAFLSKFCMNTTRAASQRKHFCRAWETGRGWEKQLISTSFSLILGGRVRHWRDQRAVEFRGYSIQLLTVPGARLPGQQVPSSFLTEHLVRRTVL